MLKDSYGRRISDLRISVTDRCNFKCCYCKTAKGLNYVEKDRLLSFEEIERVSRVLLGLGIQKIRITGGEPLLRKDLERLVERLAGLEGLKDLALTTNGYNFFRRAQDFRKAGLGRITISLDSLKPERFFEITRSREHAGVIRSIDAAVEWGFHPVKINCVVVRGMNDDEIVAFARLAREKQIEMRFIEFMPIDEDEKWSRDQVVTGGEILRILESEFRLEERRRDCDSQTSVNYSFSDGPGGIGLIMPVSQPFCGACSRLRLTADGKVRTCLFSVAEHDIRGLIRAGASDDELRAFLIRTTQRKEQGHRINHSDFVPPSRSMSYIGG